MQSKSEKFRHAAQHSVGYWLNNASRMLLRVHDERLKPLGFSMGQLPVLQALMDGSSLSQKEIAQHAGVKQPTMAEMLARMERDGVVRRTADPDDGRGSLITLAESAAERLPSAIDALFRGERDATKGLTAREVATLRGLLERVAQNLAPLDPARAATTTEPRPRKGRSKTR